MEEGERVGEKVEEGERLALGVREMGEGVALEDSVGPPPPPGFPTSVDVREGVREKLRELVSVPPPWPPFRARSEGETDGVRLVLRVKLGEGVTEGEGVREKEVVGEGEGLGEGVGVKEVVVVAVVAFWGVGEAKASREGEGVVQGVAESESVSVRLGEGVPGGGVGVGAWTVAESKTEDVKERLEVGVEKKRVVEVGEA